jgi:DNA-binding XRE family transcriptional regulator
MTITELVTSPLPQGVLRQAVDSLYAEIDRLSKPAPSWSLSRIRNERRLRQQDVAKSMGISQPKVSQLERTASVSIGELARFARACGATLEMGVRLSDGRLVPINVRLHGTLPVGLLTAGS